MAGITFAIPADEVIDTMGEIGKAMDVRYRETAGGGLAATPTGRKLAKDRTSIVRPISPMVSITSSTGMGNLTPASAISIPASAIAAPVAFR